MHNYVSSEFNKTLEVNLQVLKTVRMHVGLFQCIMVQGNNILSSFKILLIILVILHGV